MRKLTDTLSGIKSIFCRQQNSAKGTSAGCVEFTGAALRTCGSPGKRNAETGSYNSTWDNRNR